MYILSLEKHVINVSAICFHHLRRLGLIRRMLTAESAATLVHAFVTSRVDYCNVTVMPFSPELQKSSPTKLNKLQQSAFWLVPRGSTAAWSSCI